MRLIIIVAAVISGFVTISLVCFQATRKTYPGIDRWTAGVGFLTLGCSAFALRGLIPDALSIFIGNVAFPLGLVLHLDGLRRFLGSGSMPILWYAIPALDLVATAILYYAYDSAFWRSVVTGIAVSVPHWAMAYLIFRHPVKHKSIFYPVIGALLCLAGLVVLARPISAVFVGHWHILTESTFQLGSFVVLIVFQLGETLSLTMLNSERVERDLLETEADLRHMVDRMERALAEQKKTEEALRGSEERFKRVIENAGEWIWQVDANGIFQYSSSGVEKVLGYSPNELVGHKHYYDLFAPEVRESLKQAALEVFVARRSFPAFVSNNVHKDGRIVAFQTSGSPLFDGQGTFVGYRGTSIDITERKQAEELLAQNERMLRGILFTSPVAIGLAVNRKMKWVNQAWEETFGFEKRRYLGQDASIVYPSRAEYERVGKELYPDLALGYVTQTDAKFVREDGSIFAGQIRMKAIDPSDPGKGTIAAITDISERKKAEEALRESEEKYRSLLEESSDGMFVTSGTKIAFTNSRLREILGYEKGELEGKHHWTIYHSDYQAIARSRGQAGLGDQPGVNRYEVKVQRKDGSSFDCELAAKRVRVAGKPGIQAWFRDITERKQAEWQLQLEKDRLKSILDHMNDGVCMLSPQYKVEYVNPVIVKQFGDVTGRKCYEYFHGRAEPCPWCKNSEVFAGNTNLPSR